MDNKDIKKLNKILISINTRDDWDKVYQNVNTYYKLWRNTPPKDKFSVGDAISFIPSRKKYNTVHLGIIIKKNPKRVKVNVTQGSILGVWTLPYGFLKHATKEEITSMAITKLNN